MNPSQRREMVKNIQPTPQESPNDEQKYPFHLHGEVALSSPAQGPIQHPCADLNSREKLPKRSIEYRDELAFDREQADNCRKASSTYISQAKLDCALSIDPEDRFIPGQSSDQSKQDSDFAITATANQHTHQDSTSTDLGGWVGHEETEWREAGPGSRFAAVLERAFSSRYRGSWRQCPRLRHVRWGGRIRPGQRQRRPCRRILTMIRICDPPMPPEVRLFMCQYIFPTVGNRSAPE